MIVRRQFSLEVARTGCASALCVTVRLVIGAFPTLSEAESAAQALLQVGHREDAIAAFGRIGGGRLRLAGSIPVQPVGDPARLVSRAERARVWAGVGAITGLALAVLLLATAGAMEIEPFGSLSPYLAGWTSSMGFMVLLAAVGAVLGALARRTDGLPHDLAYRYGVRLDQGDTLIAVRTAPGAEARAVQELLGVQGAVFSDVTRGAVEPLGPIAPPPALAPSQN